MKLLVGDCLCVKFMVFGVLYDMDGWGGGYGVGCGIGCGIGC